MVMVAAGLEIFGVAHHGLPQRTASSASDRTPEKNAYASNSRSESTI
jgi:hypothetical protein